MTADTGVADEPVRSAREKAWMWVRVTQAALNAAVILLAVASMAFVGWNTYRIRELGRQNRIGVERIVNCTTPGMPCFDEAQARNNALVADVIGQLDRQHRTIECLLLRVPSARTEADLEECRVQASVNQANGVD